MSGSSDEDLVIRVKEVETELANLRSVVSNGQPVCPYCMAPMRPTNYSGYYDAFSFWACDCEDFPDGSNCAGAYV